MANRKSIASLLLFAGTSLCFFFPFVTVSCGGMKAFTLSGQQLATGTTLSQPQAFGPPQQQKIDADPFAAVAALCALVGVVLSLTGRRLSSGTAISGGVGAVSLLIMRSRLDSELQKQAEGMATANYEVGYALALLLMIAGSAWNIYVLLQGRRTNEAGLTEPEGGSIASRNIPNSGSFLPGLSVATDGSASPNHSEAQGVTLSGRTGTRFCIKCGQSIKPSTRFCEACGTPVDDTTAAEQSTKSVSGGNA